MLSTFLIKRNRKQILESYKANISTNHGITGSIRINPYSFVRQKIKQVISCTKNVNQVISHTKIPDQVSDNTEIYDRK